MIFPRSNTAVRSTQPITKSMSRSTQQARNFPLFKLPEDLNKGQLSEYLNPAPSGNNIF